MLVRVRIKNYWTIKIVFVDIYFDKKTAFFNARIVKIKYFHKSSLVGIRTIIYVYKLDAVFKTRRYKIESLLNRNRFQEPNRSREKSVDVFGQVPK